MRPRIPALLGVTAAVMLPWSPLSAQTPRERGDQPPVSAQKAGTRAPARGPLPDPALLDGTAQPAEKRPEYGMVGEFEIPGDANSKSDRVGGQSGQPGGGGPQMPNMPQGGGQAGISGLPPMSMPAGAAGGAAGGPQMPQGAQQGGAGGIPGGKPIDPGQGNGQGGGTQVAELKTDEANAGGVGGEPTAPKPGQVTIGDPAKQIKGVANAPGVIGGAVSAGSTQQMDKAVGGGKGGGGGPSDNSNKGVERGRVLPTGL